MSEPRPLMIGLMHTPVLEASADDPRYKAFADWFAWAVKKVRLGMATYALNEGYNLTDILEIRGVGWRDERIYEHLRDRAYAGYVAAVLVHGAVPVEKIHKIACDDGLRVYELAPVFRTDSDTPWDEQ